MDSIRQAAADYLAAQKEFSARAEKRQRFLVIIMGLCVLSVVGLVVVAVIYR